MKLLTAFALAITLAVPFGLSSVVATSATADEVSEQEQKTQWQNRYRALLNEVDAVRTRLNANRTAYTKARQRGRLRGGSGPELTELIAADEAKLATLEQELADFPDTARRAGVPPGWFRDISPASAGD